MAGFEIRHEQIALGLEIGHGEFGVVMKAIGNNLPNCEPVIAVAVKVMRPASSPSNVNAFIREGMRLKDLHHENVVCLLAVCLLQEPYYIVLEYMSYGDLKGLLRLCKNSDIQLSVAHLLSFLCDLSCGFAYLQERGFVHRDLAARNALVSGSFSVKIGDFGMAKRSYNSEYYVQSGQSSTEGSLILPIRWMAPESYFDATWDLKSDVWMFGVLMWGLYRRRTLKYLEQLIFILYRNLFVC